MGFKQTVYKSSQIRINAGGFMISRGAGASGYAVDGPFCKITPSGPSFTTRRGVDGTEASNDTNNHGADLSIFLMGTNSPSNGFMSGMLLAQEQSANGLFFTLAVEDLNGTSLFHSDSAQIMGRPEQPYGAEVADYEWKLHAIWDIWIVGGN